MQLSLKEDRKKRKKKATSLSTAAFLPLTNQSDGRAVFQGRNGRPLPCSFLSGTVSDLRQQMFAIAVPVFEDVCGDLNEEGVQLCLVPALKNLVMLTIKDEISYSLCSTWIFIFFTLVEGGHTHLSHLIVIHPQNILH